MPVEAPNLMLTTAERLSRRTEMLFAVGVISILAVLMLMLMLPAPRLSTLLACKLSISMLVLLPPPRRRV